MLDFLPLIINLSRSNQKDIKSPSPVPMKNNSPLFTPKANSGSLTQRESLKNNTISLPNLNSNDNSNTKTTSETCIFPYLKKGSFLRDHPKVIRENLRAINQLTCPSFSQIQKKFVKMPENKLNRKTLVLDLDETLVHTSYPEVSKILLKGSPDIYFSIRPYAIELLEFASKNFEVVIFTASQKAYADRILDYLDPNKQFITLRLYRESCIAGEKGFIKDIRIFLRRNLEDIIIVDNLILSFAFQIDNGIPILSWYGETKDKELKKLIDFLKVLKFLPDVRPFISNTFGLRNLQ